MIQGHGRPKHDPARSSVCPCWHSPTASMLPTRSANGLVEGRPHPSPSLARIKCTNAGVPPPLTFLNPKPNPSRAALPTHASPLILS